MEQKFCQSCGMPLNPEVLGTEKDGSKNEEYCTYCYAEIPRRKLTVAHPLHCFHLFSIGKNCFMFAMASSFVIFLVNKVLKKKIFSVRLCVALW